MSNGRVAARRIWLTAALVLAALHGLSPAPLLAGPRVVRVSTRDLYEAVRCGQLDVVMRTIDAEPGRANERFGGGLTPLHVAIRGDRTEMVEQLIDRGANVNARTVRGTTPLHYAVDRETNVRFTLCLIFAGARLDVADVDGETPLHVAIRRRRVRQARALVYKGASLAVRDGKGRTPLGLARLSGPDEIVRLLISRGAQP